MTAIAPRGNNRIRLGMFLIGGTAWRGGLNYQRTLLQALAGPLAGRFEARLFVTQDQLDLAEDMFAGLLPHPPVVDDRAAGAGAGRRGIAAVVAGIDRKAASLMAEHDVDIVFENARFLGRRFQLPVISWMPDFQHRAMPHLFSKRGWWSRDIGFRAQTTGQRLVMLSSDAARRDCERYYPASRGRTTVVRFAPSLDIAAVLSRKQEACAIHALPNRFFYMPNQFWAHKNHSTVVEALEIIRARGQLGALPPVVMSGPISENRKTAPFENLMARVTDQGLENRFQHLGLIPMQDVLALNAAAQAVLNPSFFEGWASSVEEAKALGSPLILSDIDVHREQAPDAAFFTPNNAEQLADVLMSVASSPPPRIEDIDILTNQAEGRQKAFVDSFASTLELAYKLRRDLLPS